MITVGSILFMLATVGAVTFGSLAFVLFLSNPERFLNKCFAHRVIINCERQPYLYRWYVFRTKQVSLFIHKFVRSDEDRALHDHPWSFFVIPIWRGYIEHNEWELLPSHPDFEFWDKRSRRVCEPLGIHRFVETKHRVRPIISARYRPATYRHRVELLTRYKLVSESTNLDGYVEHLSEIQHLPAWSLFFHFTKEREWGFHPAEGFVLWNKWWSSHKCGDEPE